MNYNIAVKDFLELSGKGEIDYRDFYGKFMEEMQRKDRNFIISKSEEIPEPKGSLMGLPVSVKDNICTKGMLTTAGSRILETYIPVFDATAVKRIRESGGFICAKTSMDEFGFGTFSTNCAYGIPKNPHDNERSCGGSSGGSGGLTAALDFPHISIAESTGGSISCPASFCGVVGITPTYGLVSRYGLVDYANSLDKIGCMGKTVWDAVLGLSLVAGNDSMDSTCLNEKPRDYTKILEAPAIKAKLGIPMEYMNGLEPGVEKLFWDSVKKLESEGFEYEEISLPNTKHAISAYYIIACAEASTNLAKFCGLRYGLSGKMEGDFNEYFSKIRSKGFGEEAKRRIILGTFARMAGYRSKYYLKAMKVRTLIINDFKKAFDDFDAIISPTMPILPPKFEEIKKLTPLENYQCDILTVPANLSGIPHISLPCGFASENGKKIPIGLHVLGNHLDEEKIIGIAGSAEKILGNE